MEENNKTTNQSGKLVAGIIVIIIGFALLLDNIGIDLPRWIFYWSNILIVIGLIIGFKNNFQNRSGLFLIAFGAFFTLKKAFEEIFDVDKLAWPIVIIGVGLYLIFKPKGIFKGFRNNRRNKWSGEPTSNDTFANSSQTEEYLNSTAEHKTASVDYLDSVNVFAGSHHIVYSKNFKGGDLTAIFGGCDVNLTQADFDGKVVINITAIFGGTKIIVPPGWQIKQEVTAIFGGFDDKRTMRTVEDLDKVVIIKGVALFGGVDIRSY